MDLHEDRNFFLSGLISLTFFFSLLLFIGYSLLSPVKIEQFAMTKSEFVSVSIDIAPPAKIQETPKTIQAEPIPESKPTVEKNETPVETEQQRVPDISDLFASVTSEKTSKPKEDNAKKIDALNALEQKVMSQKQEHRFSEKVKNTEMAQPTVKIVSKSGSTGPLVNAYHAKIQGLVYANFHPPAGTEGQMARVRISLDPNGRLLSYRVIAYSGNATFNSEVDWLKERLRSVSFPSNPDANVAVIEIILTAKD